MTAAKLRKFFVCVAAFALPLFAQDATIVGTVLDPSGAVVPHVHITITNSDTGQARKVATNETGQYMVPELRIGRYTVRAEVAGFKSSERKDVVLNVADRNRLDFNLEVGNTQESVNVESTAISVQTESGEVSDVITGQQVSQLATNGRSL